MPNLFPENAYVLLDGETEKRYADVNGVVTIRSTQALSGIVGGVNSTITRFNLSASTIDTSNDVEVEIPIRTFILSQDYGELTNAYINITGELENHNVVNGTVDIANGNLIQVSIVAENCKTIVDELEETVINTEHTYTLQFQFLRTFNILLEDNIAPTNAYILITGETDPRFADENGIVSFRTNDAISGIASSSDSGIFDATFNYDIITSDTTHNLILYRPYIFEDATVQAIMLANWDSDSNGIIIRPEINSITDLNLKFTNNTNITSFEELKDFDGVTALNVNEFKGNKYMRGNIGLPKNLIGATNDSIFEDCYALREVIVPNGITSLSYHSFYNCFSLRNITIPNSVLSSSESFVNCYSLSNILLPDNCIIGVNNFSNCTNLKAINIPIGNTIIRNSTYSSCNTLIEVNIPIGITSIESNAFLSCACLKLVILPNTVTSIGSDAFSGCYVLSDLILSTSLLTIGTTAFLYCYCLSELNIPSSVTSIEANAFASCHSLKSITLNSSVPPTIASTTFSITSTSLSLCKIYVPAANINTYKTASNWVALASYIFPKP